MENKYFFVIDNNSPKSLLLKKKLNSILCKENWVENEEKSEFIFVIGGDGTFLKNVDKYSDKKIVAINGGNLGYFSSFNSKNIDSILKTIKNEKLFKNILMLNVNIDNNNYWGLNEVYICSDTTLKTNIYICHQKLELFKGTGLMVSTPMGSTAHNKNAGGAIIWQNENLIQLLEVHPITQKKYSTLKSPLILNYNSTIELINASNDFGNIIIDGNKIKDCFINKIKITTEFSHFKVCVPTTLKPYIQKLRDSFIREK